MNSELLEGLAGLERRAQWARFLIAAVIATSLAYAAGVIGILQGWMGSSDMFIGDMHVVDMAAIVHFVTLAGSCIAVGMWIHKAHANLEAADFPALEFSPGWSVGWFFVPIASLFKPFQAMRELWNASHGAIGDYSDPAPGFFWVWWLCWIFSGIGGQVETVTMLDVASMALTVVSAGALLVIVNTVTRQQHTMDVAETFA